MNYVIGTGWWCTSEDKREAKFLNGENYIRSAEFHRLWAKAIKSFCNPSEVIVVDSASPIKADWDRKILPYRVLELSKNLGHATKLNNTKYCGWMASVMMSLEYAVYTDAEYYVYVEQDALLMGENIIENCINNMKPNIDFAFGSTPDNTQPLQQSFFIIKRSGFEKFITNLKRIPYTDAQMAPEVKFALATSNFLMGLPLVWFTQSFTKFGKAKRRFNSFILKKIAPYAFLNIGYGRNRPIRFDDLNFYFQHGSADELAKYSELLVKRKR